MSKFMIECPSCGQYTEAKTGLLAKRKIQCTCGNIINVRTDRYICRTCPHCGNTFLYDQSKGQKIRCPVCREKIEATLDDTKLVEFSCHQCGIRLQTTKNASEYTCPVCGCINDVQEQLKLEQIKRDGLASIIKYEGDNDTFVWKHPIEDFNLGSQLIVHESQEAIFFRDGQALDLFGAGRYTLETQQLPILEKLYKLPTDTEGTFHSEVYFINKTVQMAVKWGTPDKVRFIDPLTGVPLELGASGEMNIAVSDARKLIIKLVGSMKGIAWGDRQGFTRSLQSSFRPVIVTAVKTNLSAIIKKEAIDLLEIDEHLDVISHSLQEKIRESFEEYGLTVPEFYVTNVVLPENDPNFKRIRDLHTITLQTRVYQAEAAVKAAQAQSETLYRTAQEQSRAAIETARREAELQRQTTETEIARKEAERRIIAAQAEAQAQRMAGLTEAEVMRAKGYTEKDLIQAEVQKAYAESLGEMGSSVNIGGSSGNGGGMMNDILGLGVGMAAMNAVMPQVGNMMQGMMPPAESSSPAEAVPSPEGWTCTCGQKNITSPFCPSCGKKKPESGWTCPQCGHTGITSNFCPDCGHKKPEAPKGWTCPDCGKMDIMSNFCPNCGAKKPDSAWVCPECGEKDIKTDFCPNCGHKKGE